jgi:mRNA interferase RelE/StbE
MSYTIITPKSVQKQLDGLPNDVYERIVVRIQQLAEDPRPDGVVKIKGTNDEYRVRVGDYRLRYEIDDENLIVLLLLYKHRRDVYRKN